MCNIKKSIESGYKKLELKFWPARVFKNYMLVGSKHYDTQTRILPVKIYQKNKSILKN